MVRTIHNFDVIVIGAGSAGLSALKEARKYTSNVMMVHNDDEGDACARLGSMPSKNLIQIAKIYDSRKQMPEAGIHGSENLLASIPEILEKVREDQETYIEKISKEIKDIEPFIVRGTASLESPTTIRCNGKLFHGKAIILATGSRPIIPDKYKEFGPHLITSDTLFEHKDLPPRIAVIGLDAIGLEMAQAFAKLGIDVTAITHHDEVGVVSDPKINATVRDALNEDMKIWLSTEPEVMLTQDGLVVQGNEQETTVDAIFLGTGRKPNTETLGLEKLGINTNGSGVPPFNRYTMKVPGHPIFLAGDVTDQRAVLHEAVDDGRRAAYHAIHGEKGYSPRYAQMQVVFTKPATAVVGDTEYAMRHDRVVIGEADFSDLAGVALAETDGGKIRLYADSDGGYFRGAEIMAPAGEHLAHFLALSLTQRLTIEQILETPFYHPTLEEGLRHALEDANEKIHYE